MSYCRWGWDGSDVYIYESCSADKPYLVCCGCGSFATFGELMHHIDEHRMSKEHVPSYVDERIAAEIEAGTSGIPTGDLPTDRPADPGVQRPEPERFTQLKENLARVRELLGREADEAEERAEAEERGDVPPMPGQRPRTNLT